VSYTLDLKELLLEGLVHVRLVSRHAVRGTIRITVNGREYVIDDKNRVLKIDDVPLHRLTLVSSGQHNKDSVIIEIVTETAGTPDP
jgi:ribosomal 30S subunit maturation factor RimM